MLATPVLRAASTSAASAASAAAAASSAALSAALSSASSTEYSNYSGMVPNLAFNVCMAVIFGLLLVMQVGIGIWTKQWWFLVSFTFTCILEVLGYAGRASGHFDVYNVDTFLLQFITLTIAPVFTMAGIYYQLAKLIEVYGHRFAVIKNPMLYSYIFMACDIISLIVQAVGGGMAGSAAADHKDPASGDHVFVAGLAFQVASMSAFLILWFHLVYQIFVATRMQHTGAKRASLSLFRVPQEEIDYLYRPKFEFLRLHPKRWVFTYFPWILTAASLLIFVRCIYRVIELAEGWSGNLITHEVYFIILDALMMSLATTLLTVCHPGFVFKGRTTRIPIQNVRKAVAKDGAENATDSLEDDNDSWQANKEIA
ncbi:LAQU0S04e00342g1_1 [Lachancea quebecensis]|uniref:Sphingoid long-chain base transporter RSB1 n=1 Tax=Lachancea quebecensis TaxID=1654605 RepID=A0A0P1KXJ7_9SACH|nr:LAQU0S04e00342g1_1 [Lachancea quebecensis]